ncbi:hypothetical protein JOM56_015328 [Amanita muscaria]
MNSTSNPYPSHHGNFSLVASSHLQPDQDWVSQQVEVLMAVNAHIDAKLRELQDLYHKQQYTLARLRTSNATTTTSTWNIPLQPTTSKSSSTAPYAQNVTHPRPEYNRAGNKASGYETSPKGEATWHRESLKHAKKSHICHCGKGYSRRDSLLRHAAIHASENSYI